MLPLDAVLQPVLKRVAQALAEGIIVATGLSGCTAPGPSAGHATAATPAEPNHDSAFSQAPSRVMALNDD